MDENDVPDRDSHESLLSRVGHAVKDIILDDSAGPADTADPRPLGYGARTGEFGTVDSITNPATASRYQPGTTTGMPNEDVADVGDPLAEGVPQAIAPIDHDSA